MEEACFVIAAKVAQHGVQRAGLPARLTGFETCLSYLPTVSKLLKLWLSFPTAKQG